MNRSDMTKIRIQYIKEHFPTKITIRNKNPTKFRQRNISSTVLQQPSWTEKGHEIPKIAVMNSYSSSHPSLIPNQMPNPHLTDCSQNFPKKNHQAKSFLLHSGTKSARLGPKTSESQVLPVTRLPAFKLD